MPRNPALGWLRQKDSSLSYIVMLDLKAERKVRTVKKWFIVGLIPNE